MRVNLSDLFVYIFENSKRCHSRVDRYSYSTLDAFFLVHSRVLIGWNPLREPAYRSPLCREHRAARRG